MPCINKVLTFTLPLSSLQADYFSFVIFKISGYLCKLIVKQALSINTLKDTVIILMIVILVFKTLSSTSLQILPPKGYDKHLCHFYMGGPPPPHPSPPKTYHRQKIPLQYLQLKQRQCSEGIL